MNDSVIDGATNVVEYGLSADGTVLTARERFRGAELSYDNVWVLERAT